VVPKHRLIVLFVVNIMCFDLLFASCLRLFCVRSALFYACFCAAWRGTAAKVRFWIRLITCMLPLAFGIKKTMVFFAL
jgi:hypothetical protein